MAPTPYKTAKIIAVDLILSISILALGIIPLIMVSVISDILSGPISVKTVPPQAHIIAIIINAQ